MILRRRPPILRSAICYLLMFLSVTLLTWGFQSFVPNTSRQQTHRRTIHVTFANDDKQSGYKFGDFTKGLIKKATSRINNVTGENEYKFGDLSRWADSRVKDRINNITGKDEYEFGDLTRWSESQVKTKVANYTGKEDYVVGDISKEIIRRVGTGEYTTEDVVLLCKALVTFGVGLTPVARILPAKLLLEMMSFGLAEEVGGRFMGALSKTLDERFKETITGDPNYRLGDKTKQAVQNLMAMADQKDSASKTESEARASNKDVISSDEMDATLLAELEDWDRRLGIVGNETSAGSTK